MIPPAALSLVLLALQGAGEPPIPAAPVAETTWSPAQTLALAESSAGRLVEGRLLLAAGESLRLRLPSATPFRSGGIYWRGEVAALRASWDAAEDSWMILPEAHDLAPAIAGVRGAAGRARVSGLIHSYQGPRQALHLEIRGPASLAGLSLVTIAASSAGPVSTATTSPAGSRGYPKPPVEPRSAWNADPPACSFSYCSVTHLAIHHTAGANEYSSPGYAQCAANVKAIQSYHLYTRGWCDIGYQYLVCVHGRLWEGRPGDDVVGAHDAHNCGSMATAYMGYFHAPYSQQPTAAMLDATAELGAWKCDQRGIDPLGSSWYSGFGGVMDNVYGHRDVGSTSCPGDLLDAELPGLRQAIDARLNGGAWSLVLDNPSAHFQGSWNTGTSSPDKYGPDYRWASTGTAQALAWWTPTLPQAGLYEISLWWPQGSNRNPATRVGLRLNGQTLSTTVDQRFQGGQWNPLGTVWLPAGNATPIGLSNEGPASSVVVADALRLVRR